MNLHSRSVFIWLGRALSAIAVGWLLYELWIRWTEIDPDIVSAGALATVIVASVVLGAAYFLIALNWRDLVVYSDPEAGAVARSLIRSTMTTQIAKYIPGNFSHLLGRHALGRKLGLAHRALGRAFALETVILIVAAILVAMIAFTILPGGSFIEEAIWRTAIGMAVLVAVGAVAVVLVRRGRREIVLLASLARSAGWILVFGLSFWALLAMIFPVSIGSALAAAAIGWAVGFATPGSPGGIGTREGAMTLMLSPSVPLEALLPALALFRLVTVGADLVCFAIGRAMGKDD